MLGDHFFSIRGRKYGTVPVASNVNFSILYAVQGCTYYYRSQNNLKNPMRDPTHNNIEGPTEGRTQA